ncbi:hypothetical protein BDW22DRAFT_116937 [Trametopsis cervina]|nr:hypothetical protein BDW22DRAFT_116937 [Trametopsis cervina]
MATLPDRKTLGSMRRADLQKLCKERGLKANLKTEELIDMLVETNKPAEPPRVPGRSSSVRIVSGSSRVASSSTTRSRVGSMIVHDVEEKEEESAEDTARSSVPPETPQPHTLGGPTRKRALQTQSRLGVGRPTAIGGTGARTATSSFGKPRSRRGKASASVLPSERAIQEEEEEPEAVPMPVEEPEAGPSGTTLELQPPPVTSVVPSAFPSIDADTFIAYISRIVEPLKAELTALSKQVAEREARELEQARLIESMREELSALRVARIEGPEHTDMDTEMLTDRTAVASSAQSNRIELYHTPKSTLGKRYRNTDENGVPSEGSGHSVASNGETTTNHVLRSSRKKPRLNPPEDQSMSILESDAAGEEDAENEVEMAEVVRRPFTVYTGPEDHSDSQPLPDEPPPTTRLSDIFAPPAMTPPNGATPFLPTGSQLSTENEAPSTGNAFSFSFANSIFRPMTSTPAVRSNTLPPPEPPTSPSPAGPGGPNSQRAAHFLQQYSAPRPGSRPSSRAAQSQSQLGVLRASTAGAGPSREPTVAPGEGMINPAALTQPGSLAPVPEEPSSSTNGQGTMYANPLRVGSLGMGLPGIVPLPMPPDTPSQPMKRTMYGTELDGDSRFGDFGVEGVAMGFWTGAAPRF